MAATPERDGGEAEASFQRANGSASGKASLIINKREKA